MDHFYVAIEEYKRSIGQTAENLFDIGSFDGSSANMLATGLSIDPKRVYCVDASPLACEVIRNNYPYNVFQYAVSDFVGKGTFNISYDTKDGGNPRINSLRDRDDFNHQDKINVDVITLRNLFYQHTVERTLDILKIDVEGCAYEVLQGAGNLLIFTNMVIIETESRPYWRNQTLSDEVFELLTIRGFECKWLIEHDGQSDSVWVNVKWLDRQ